MESPPCSLQQLTGTELRPGTPDPADIRLQPVRGVLEANLEPRFGENAGTSFRPFEEAQ